MCQKWQRVCTATFQKLLHLSLSVKMASFTSVYKHV